MFVFPVPLNKSSTVGPLPLSSVRSLWNGGKPPATAGHLKGCLRLRVMGTGTRTIAALSRKHKPSLRVDVAALHATDVDATTDDTGDIVLASYFFCFVYFFSPIFFFCGFSCLLCGFHVEKDPRGVRFLHGDDGRDANRSAFLGADA